MGERGASLPRPERPRRLTLPPELLAIPFGIAVGILLGLLGGGGSILAVPVLVYVLGQEVRAATTESLIIVGATAAIAAVAHHRAGHVRWRPALVFSSAAAIGAFAGTALNRLVDPEALLASFALLLLLAAAGSSAGEARHQGSGVRVAAL